MPAHEAPPLGFPRCQRSPSASDRGRDNPVGRRQETKLVPAQGRLDPPLWGTGPITGTAWRVATVRHNSATTGRGPGPIPFRVQVGTHRTAIPAAVSDLWSGRSKST